MSFKCDLCKKNVKAGIPCTIVPYKIREKEYHVKNRIVYGWEIEKEVHLCPECAEKFEPPVYEKRIDTSFNSFSWFHEFTSKRPKTYRKKRKAERLWI